MSCFICSDAHFSTIAKAVFPESTYSDSAQLAQTLANTLKRINIESFNTRYGEKIRVTKCSMKKARSLDVHNIAKLIQSWSYQSCENAISVDFPAYVALLDQFVTESKGDSKLGEFWSI
jgi:hypothetical protein